MVRYLDKARGSNSPNLSSTQNLTFDGYCDSWNIEGNELKRSKTSSKCFAPHFCRTLVIRKTAKESFEL